MVSPWPRVATGGLLLLLGIHIAPGYVSACTVSVIPLQVPSTFKLVVHDGKEPTAGLEVKIERRPSLSEEEDVSQQDQEEQVVLRGLTDSNGEFKVDGLAPGEYWISVGEETEFGWYRAISVGQQQLSRAPSLLFVSWLPDEVLRVKRFEGVMVFGQLGSGEKVKALSNATLMVKDGRTKQVLRETQAAEDGTFAVGQLPAGLYSVHVSARVQYPAPANLPPSLSESPLFRRIESGRFALEISTDPNAMDAQVEVAWSFTSCGASPTWKVVPVN